MQKPAETTNISADSGIFCLHFKLVLKNVNQVEKNFLRNFIISKLKRVPNPQSRNANQV
jgi:hypothetical protein